MKFTIFFITFLCLLACGEVDAISSSAQKKYPYVLLGADYGILDENDLGDFSWGETPKPFNPAHFGRNYWQCFPRESIQFMLKDAGFSVEEVGWRDNVADLEIQVWISPTLIHEYSMRARWAVTDFEKRFNKWRRIVRGEKYVCLAGDYVNREYRVENGIKREVYNWIFEKIKTKKGCDSYLHVCNPTYKAYLEHKAKEEFLLHAAKAG
jgi:hypothetical protein